MVKRVWWVMLSCVDMRSDIPGTESLMPKADIPISFAIRSRLAALLLEQEGINLAQKEN